MIIFRPIAIVLVAAALFACGTKVDVGDNRKEALNQNGKDDPYVEEEGSESGDAQGEADSSSCFGASTELEPSFLELCGDLDADIRENFQTILNVLCDEKRLANLLKPKCAWDGGANQTKFLRVLSRTDLDDQSVEEFNFLAAFSVAVDTSAEENIALFFKSIADPDFSKRYLNLKNSRYSDVDFNEADQSIDYLAELNSSVAMVKFRGHAQAVSLNPALTAVFDRSTGDEITILNHSLVHLFYKLDATSSIEVVIDEKLVDDDGSHRVAYKTLLDIDTQRMGMSVANAKR